MTYSKPCIIQQRKTHGWQVYLIFFPNKTWQFHHPNKTWQFHHPKKLGKKIRPFWIDLIPTSPIHPENLRFDSPIRFHDDPPVVEHPKKKGSALENTGLEFEGCDFSLNSLPKVAKLQHTRKLDKAIGDVFFLPIFDGVDSMFPEKKTCTVKHLIVWYVYT